MITISWFSLIFLADFLNPNRACVGLSLASEGVGETLLATTVGGLVVAVVVRIAKRRQLIWQWWVRNVVLEGIRTMRCYCLKAAGGLRALAKELKRLEEAMRSPA